MDRKALEGILKEAEAVVHMGAIPGPLRAEPRFIFENNVAADFNVMMSAAELGLRRVVFSSSAFGMGWAHDGNAFVPLYLPLDEEHPMMPFEPYGLTKQVGEDIGRMIARNSGTTVVSLRFTNVALPEVQAEFPWPAPTPENPLTLVMWAYADARDVAEAHVLALDAEIEEYEAFMIAQPSSRFEEPTIDLVKKQLWRPGGDTGRVERRRQRNQYGKGAATAGLETPPRLEVKGGAKADLVAGPQRLPVRAAPEALDRRLVDDSVVAGKGPQYFWFAIHAPAPKPRPAFGSWCGKIRRLGSP